MVYLWTRARQRARAAAAVRCLGRAGPFIFTSISRAGASARAHAAVTRGIESYTSRSRARNGAFCHVDDALHASRADRPKWKKPRRNVCRDTRPPSICASRTCSPKRARARRQLDDPRTIQELESTQKTVPLHTIGTAHRPDDGARLALRNPSTRLRWSSPHSMPNCTHSSRVKRVHPATRLSTTGLPQPPRRHA